MVRWSDGLDALVSGGEEMTKRTRTELSPAPLSQTFTPLIDRKNSHTLILLVLDVLYHVMALAFYICPGCHQIIGQEQPAMS